MSGYKTKADELLLARSEAKSGFSNADIDEVLKEICELRQENSDLKRQLLLTEVAEQRERELREGLEDKLTAMRGALEFYACNGTYKAFEIRTGNGGYSDPPIVIDEGERAREALKKLEGK